MPRWPDKLPWMGLAGAAGLSIATYLAAAQYWTSAFLALLLLALGLTAVKLARKEVGRNTYMPFVVALVAMALLVALGVEFVRVQDDIGRMNTQFKFYVQVWVLLALASACILWYLKEQGVFRMGRVSIVRGGFLVVLALLVGSSFFYTILGTRDRLADRFDTGSFTLDGAHYMTTTGHHDRTTGALIEHRWDYQAIEWLQDNVQGSPVVLEAHTDQYHWGGAHRQLHRPSHGAGMALAPDPAEDEVLRRYSGPPPGYTDHLCNGGCGGIPGPAGEVPGELYSGRPAGKVLLSRRRAGEVRGAGGIGQGRGGLRESGHQDIRGPVV